MKELLAEHNFAEYFNRYINLVDDEEILIVLEKNNNNLRELFDLLVESQGEYRYAEDKWSIKELLVHLIDAERIFCYRALSFARNDSTDLPGFDHDEYVKYSDANNRTLNDIAKEFEAVRRSTIALYKNFSTEILNASGTANGNKLTVTAIGYIIVGHATHHINILEEKYLHQ